MSRRRALAANLLALVFGTVVAVAAGEFLLRLFWPQRSPVTVGMFRQDPDAGFRLQEGFRNEVRTPEFRTKILVDADGYRVPERLEPPASGARRLLVTGDSFAFGVGVDAEEAFPERLAERLGPGWWVRNGGVGGYGPLRSSRLLILRQAAWEPEVLVHAFYLGNDLEDPKPDRFLEYPRVVRGRMVAPGRPAWVELRLFLRTRSHLYSFLRERLYGLYRWSGLSTRGQYLEPVGLAEWPPKIADVGWPAGRDALREMRDWAVAADVRLLVVLVPAKYHVEDEAWRVYREAWGGPAPRFDRDHARREVAGFLDEIGVTCLDLTDALREAAAAGTGLYYPVDRHWTAAGHELAAERIVAELASRGWLASASPLRTTPASAPASR